MYGPPPPPWFSDNGCTFAPDSWRGINLRPACRRHDWHYTKHVNCYRWQADGWFYLNLRTLGASRTSAFFYFFAVRLFGGLVGRLCGSPKVWQAYEGPESENPD